MGGGGGVSTQAKNKDERAIYQRNSSACLMVGGMGGWRRAKPKDSD